MAKLQTRSSKRRKTSHSKCSASSVQHAAGLENRRHDKRKRNQTTAAAGTSLVCEMNDGPYPPRNQSSSKKTCDTAETYASEALPSSSPKNDCSSASSTNDQKNASVATYNTSTISSSGSREFSSEPNETNFKAMPHTARDEIVFSFRPHKSKKKRNSKNIKLSGPMKPLIHSSYIFGWFQLDWF